MRVATLVLNWNGKDDTLDCLRSLAATETDGWEHTVVVVDNASTDGTVEAVRAAFPGVRILENGGNLGFAEGNNRAMEWARAEGFDHVILLNNDTVVEPDALGRLVEQAQRPNVGAVMPLIRYHDEPEVWHAGGRVVRATGRVEPLPPPSGSEPYRVQVFTACCVLLPVPVLEEVGLFDPRYFIYLEDTDLALRIGEAGYDIWVVPEAEIYHKVSSTSGGSETPTALYYAVRNNLLLIRARSGNGLHRALGYAYMVALSGKIGVNLFVRRLPQKRGIARAVSQAWGDFLGSRWGMRP